MTKTNVQTNRLCQHCRQSGMSKKESSRFSSKVQKWIECSGEEWTVDRIKSLQSAWKQHISTGNPYEVPEGFAVRLNRKGQRIFKDALLHNLFVRDPGSDKNLKFVQAILRSYQVVSKSVPSRKQFRKTLATITTPQSESEKTHTEFYGRKVREAAFTCFKHVKPFTVTNRPLSHMSLNPNKSSPMPVEYYNVSTNETLVKMVNIKRQSVECKDIYSTLARDKDAQELWRKYPKEFSDCLVGTNVTLPVIRVGETPVDLPAGTIGYIPEPGCKLRQVANPLLPWQALLQPLKDKMEYLMTTQREIYVHDQDAGRIKAMEALQRGETVYCFDASSWTDRLPWPIQREMLVACKDMGHITEFDLAVMDKFVSKKWQVKDPINRHIFDVRYGAGQPMGAGPSFFVATNTHQCIVVSLSDLQQRGKYALVGDDSAFWNTRLANSYKECMDKIGVPINLQKSIVSAKFAEFCGKIISDRSVSLSMKVKPISNDDSLVSALAFYGAKGWKNLTPRELKWVVKALLPEDLGGLGHQSSLSTYSGYVNSLNCETIQNHRLKRQLTGLLKPENRHSKMDTLQHISDFNRSLTRGVKNMFLLRWDAEDGTDPKFRRFLGQIRNWSDDWMGLPSKSEPQSLGTNPRFAARTTKTTFSDVWDDALRAELEGNLKSARDESRDSSKLAPKEYPNFYTVNTTNLKGALSRLIYLHEVLGVNGYIKDTVKSRKESIPILCSKVESKEAAAKAKALASDMVVNQRSEKLRKRFFTTLDSIESSLNAKQEESHGKERRSGKTKNRPKGRSR